MDNRRVASELIKIAKELTARKGIWNTDDAGNVISDLKKALTKWVDKNKTAIEHIANVDGVAVLTIYNSEGKGIFDLTIDEKIKTRG